jgi:hypothetical protein
VFTDQAHTGPPRDSAEKETASRLHYIPTMLPVALVVGLDSVQCDACRSALDAKARVISVSDVEDAVTMLSLHRPKLVVMRTDLHPHQRRMLADLTAKVGGRIASVGEKASAVNVEHLIEGFAAVTFSTQDTEQRISSGVQKRIRPGEYHFEASRAEAVNIKAKR